MHKKIDFINGLSAAIDFHDEINHVLKRTGNLEPERYLVIRNKFTGIERVDLETYQNMERLHIQALKDIQEQQRKFIIKLQELGLLKKDV